MLLKPSVMSKPERKITEGLKIQFKVLLNFAPNWAGRTHWHQLCTGPVKTFEARFVHVARGPTFAIFSHLAFVRRPGVATTPCVSPRHGVEVVRTHPHRQASGRTPRPHDATQHRWTRRPDDAPPRREDIMASSRCPPRPTTPTPVFRRLRWGAADTHRPSQRRG